MKMLAFLLFGLFALISCTPLDFQDVTTANNLFSSDVYKQVLKQTSGNFIASPFSAEAVLALAQSGAKGETAEEIRNALRLPNSSEKIENGFKSLLGTIKGNELYSLHTANKIYVKDGVSLHETYEEIARSVYRSEIEKIKFYPGKAAAANTMNRWVEEKTNHKIKNLISPARLNEVVKMILINAIYFKGEWTETFDTDYYQKKFTKLNGDMVNTDFIKKTSDFKYYESKELNARFLEIPFKGDDASFVIILPNEKEDFSKLENQAEKIFKKLEFSYYAYVDVHIPKFKAETTIEFTKILKNLGVNKAFDWEEADFKGIAKHESLYISDVLQKAFFELTETGVEAAAATYVLGIVETSLSTGESPKPTPFYADHPFIFYIKVKDVILFVGRIVDFP